MEDKISGGRQLLKIVVGWFDKWNVPESESSELDRPDWLAMVPFLFLHVACLGVFWVGWSWTAVLIAIGLYLSRMFAITAFYHRYFSHRSYKASRWTQFAFAVFGNSAVQKGPLWWAAHHRDHHRHSDKEGDIHSPHQQGFYWSHFGWLTSRRNFRTKLENVKDLARFPELRFLDRFDTLIPLLLATILFLLGYALGESFPNLGTSGPQLLVWGFFVSTVSLFHGTFAINSFAHIIGRRRYQTTDQSRNNFILALITLGEGWHNNHHHFPAATRQGFYWWEIDMTYYVLKFFSWLGIVWDLRGVPEHVRSAEKL